MVAAWQVALHSHLLLSGELRCPGFAGGCSSLQRWSPNGKLERAVLSSVCTHLSCGSEPSARSTRRSLRATRRRRGHASGPPTRHWARVITQSGAVGSSRSARHCTSPRQRTTRPSSVIVQHQHNVTSSLFERSLTAEGPTPSGWRTYTCISIRSAMISTGLVHRSDRRVQVPAIRYIQPLADVGALSSAGSQGCHPAPGPQVSTGPGQLRMLDCATCADGNLALRAWNCPAGSQRVRSKPIDRVRAREILKSARSRADVSMTLAQKKGSCGVTVGPL